MARFDLRTPQFLNAGFPRVNGVVAGTVTVDSIWSDVRFHDADLLDGGWSSTPVSRFKGGGKARRWARRTSSWTSTPPRSPFGDDAGPVVSANSPSRFVQRNAAEGTVGDLAVTADLVGDAGRSPTDSSTKAPRHGALARGQVTDWTSAARCSSPGAPTAASTDDSPWNWKATRWRICSVRRSCSPTARWWTASGCSRDRQACISMMGWSWTRFGSSPSPACSRRAADWASWRREWTRCDSVAWQTRSAGSGATSRGDRRGNRARPCLGRGHHR